MIKRENTCTVCGLNVHRLEEHINQSELLLRIKQDIELSILDGYTTFQTGMSMGIDIWAAQIIIGLEKKCKDLKLICYQPCETQPNRWPQKWREDYFEILSKSDEVVCLQAHYSSGCIQRRNIMMICNSARLIAVQDHISISRDCAAHLVRCAEQWNLDIKLINPYNLKC